MKGYFAVSENKSRKYNTKKEMINDISCYIIKKN